MHDVKSDWRENRAHFAIQGSIPNHFATPFDIKIAVICLLSEFSLFIRTSEVCRKRPKASFAFALLK